MILDNIQLKNQKLLNRQKNTNSHVENQLQFISLISVNILCKNAKMQKWQVRALFPPLTEVFLFSTFNSKSRDKHVLTDMRRAFTDIPIKLSISDLHQRISCQGARLTGDWFEQLFESFLVTVELVVSSDELLPKLLRLNLTTPAQLFTIGDF